MSEPWHTTQTKNCTAPPQPVLSRQASHSGRHVLYLNLILHFIQNRQESLSCSENNNQNNQPEQPQPQPQPESEAVDVQGKTNVSRGIIGLVTSNQQDTGYITEGTIADKVNPVTRLQKPGKDGKINPVTEEDLKKRMDDERERAGIDSEIQEQRVIKMRTEQQGFKYTPPDHLKDIVALAPTPDYTQEKEPNPDAEQNESQINVG